MLSWGRGGSGDKKRVFFFGGGGGGGGQGRIETLIRIFVSNGWTYVVQLNKKCEQWNHAHIW